MDRLFKSLPGFLLVSGLFLFAAWSIVGGAIKPFGPGLLGYSELGWIRGGAGTTYGFGTPRWAGVEGLAAGVLMPFNHHKVRLSEGDVIEVDYSSELHRGDVSVSIFRTNYSRFWQGVLVEDHMYQRFSRTQPEGRFRYIVPQDGFYEIDWDIWWEKTPKDAGPWEHFKPDYDVRYDIRWRVLERDTQA